MDARDLSGPAHTYAGASTTLRKFDRSVDPTKTGRWDTPTSPKSVVQQSLSEGNLGPPSVLEVPFPLRESVAVRGPSLPSDTTPGSE